MRTAEEIRKYRDALLIAVASPCNCASTGHVFECRMGELAMNDAINTLAWVLKEQDVESAITFEARVRKFIEATS